MPTPKPADIATADQLTARYAAQPRTSGQRHLSNSDYEEHGMVWTIETDNLRLGYHYTARQQYLRQAAAVLAKLSTAQIQLRPAGNGRIVAYNRVTRQPVALIVLLNSAQAAA